MLLLLMMMLILIIYLFDTVFCAQRILLLIGSLFVCNAQHFRLYSVFCACHSRMQKLIFSGLLLCHQPLGCFRLWLFVATCICFNIFGPMHATPCSPPGCWVWADGLWWWLAASQRVFLGLYSDSLRQYPLRYDWLSLPSQQPRMFGSAWLIPAVDRAA